MTAVCMTQNGVHWMITINTSSSISQSHIGFIFKRSIFNWSRATIKTMTIFRKFCSCENLWIVFLYYNAIFAVGSTLHLEMFFDDVGMFYFLLVPFIITNIVQHHSVPIQVNTCITILIVDLHICDTLLQVENIHRFLK